MALNGTDVDTNNGVVAQNDTANCAQANAGTIPVSNIGADDTVNDYGGEIRRECKQNAAADCDPANCTVYPEDSVTNPTYHPDCRYASEFNMLGTADTIDPDRHPWDQISGVAPSAPPWFFDLDDTHHDNGGSNNALVAGTGQTDATYDESGTYYLCYRQDRDPGAPGYQTFTFLKYIASKLGRLNPCPSTHTLPRTPNQMFESCSPLGTGCSHPPQATVSRSSRSRRP